MRNKIVIAIVIAVAALGVFAFEPKVYLLREEGSGAIYWNQNQALLFMGSTVSGARMSYPRYALEPLLVGMWHVRAPNDERCSQGSVIEVTDKEIKHFDTDASHFVGNDTCDMDMAVFNGHLYIGYLGRDMLWRWSSDHYEPATPDELRAFDASKTAEKAFLQRRQFDNVDGWSMRQLGTPSPRYDLHFGDATVTVIYSGQHGTRQSESVDVILPGQSAVRVWSIEPGPRSVTKAQYDSELHFR